MSLRTIGRRARVAVVVPGVGIELFEGSRPSSGVLGGGMSMAAACRFCVGEAERWR